MENTDNLICPLCKAKLTKQEKCVCCNSHHNFDIAKQGYINLLPVQSKHSLNPGDTKEMLVARRQFLNAGFYKDICSSVTTRIKAIADEQKNSTPVIVDIGCGEGYYTNAINAVLDGSICTGIDISKDGVKMACSRSKDILWLVATASSLPIASESTNIITAMFSLTLPQEFARILKKGGYVIEVTAGNHHLKQLKEIIYDTVFEQNKSYTDTDKYFKTVSCDEYSFDFTLQNSDLVNLLKMTPHYWRIKEQHRIELEHTPCLSLTANYRVRVLKRI